VLAAFLTLQDVQTLTGGVNVNVSADGALTQTEMSVDVNPTNPLNLAGFSHRRGAGANNVELYFSFDGGATWGTSAIVDGVDGFTSVFRFDPSIAFDADGLLYVAYGVDDMATDTRRLVVGRSSDGGASFDQFSTVDTSAFGTNLDKWHLATGLDPSTGNQAVYVAYIYTVTDEVKVSGSNNGGAAWTTPITINDDFDKDDVSFPDPAVGPNGELYVSWHDRDDDEIKVDTNLDGLFTDGLFDNDDTFGADVVAVELQEDLFFDLVPAQPERGIFTNPVLDVDRSGGPFEGTLYISYGDVATDGDDPSNANIYVVRSVNEGATWSTRTLVDAGTGAVPNNSTEFHAWVDVDQRSGSVNVIYYTTQGDEGAGNDDVNVRLATSTDGAATFPAAQQVNLSDATSNAAGGDPADYLEYIGLAVLDGTAHGLWSDQRAAFSPDQEAVTASASYGSAGAGPIGGGGNILMITGDDGGVSVDDDIIIRRSTANVDFLEVIQNGIIAFAGLFASINEIIVDTFFGDDLVTFDFINGEIFPGNGISINLGDPVASDILRVVGQPGTSDVIHVFPTSQGAGGIGRNENAIESLYTNVEQIDIVLQYDDLDLFRVEGTDGDDLFQVFSGVTPGTGTVLGIFDQGAMPDESFSIPTITFQGDDAAGAGIFNFNGAGGTDSYEFYGLDTNEVFDVQEFGGADVDLRHSVNGVDFNRYVVSSISSYTIEANNGDDVVDFTNAPTFGGVSFHFNGGNPSAGSDVLNLTGAPGTGESVTIAPDSTNPTDQNVTGLAAGIDVSGMELITYTGVDGDDSLTVRPGAGDHDVRVDNGPSGDTDRVISDALPEIHFTELLTFTIDEAGNFGNIRATFVTTNLAGAANYQTILDSRDTLVVEGADGQGDSFTVVNPAGAPSVAITDNVNLVTVTDLGTGINPLGRVEIKGLGGDDSVTVDVGSTDVIGVPITFDGGGGSDSLTVSGTPATAVNEVIYSPGADVTSGRLLYENAANAVLMTINFANLEPVVDLVAAAMLTVNATNANNAINYTVGGVVTNGLVSVDGFETIEFSNKQNLILNGLAGSDTTNLNNPNTPTALTSITVNSNDPTAGSDTVVVNGTTALNLITVDMFTVDGARVTGAQPVPVTVTTTENLIINGQGGDDVLTYTSPAGIQELTLTPGATLDAASITSRNVGGSSLLPLSYVGLGDAGQLLFLDAAGARVDTLTVRGTDAADSFFYFAASDTLIEVLETVIIGTNDIDLLTLLGLAGNDQFVIEGDHPFGALIVQGGEPNAGSDLLMFTGSGANPVTVNLDNQTVTETTFQPVVFTGIETLEVDSAAANLTILTTDGDDLTEIHPTGLSSGTVKNNDASPLVEFVNAGIFTVDQQTGDDVLEVHYTTNPETIDVDVPAGMISRGGLETVNFVNANTEALQVLGEEGNDTFNVTADLNIPIFIDGGDPIGTSAGDQLNILAGGDPVVAEPGPENDEGGFIVGLNERVSYDHIEALGVVGAPKAFISGTNGDDDITVIARDASTHAGADGIQDFTTTVNANPAILWIDTPQLVIDALSGDDDIVMRVPAPNDADWDMEVWVFGGAPAAGPGDEGDRFELETPYGGPDNILYTPTAVDSGTMVIDENLNGVFDGTDTVIQLGNVPPMPPMPGLPVPDPGGIETLVYDGEAGDDLLTVFGTVGSDVILHSPGTDPDEGTVLVNSLLAILYNDLGLAGTLNIDGGLDNDLLIVDGFASNDLFSVPQGVVPAPSIGLNTRIGIGTASVETYRLRGLNGDDTFNITAQADIVIIAEGDDPGGSDVLNFNSTGATIVNLGARAISDAGVAGDPDAVFFGIEIVNVHSFGNDLTVVGTGVDDVIDVTPRGTSNGTLQANAVAPVVNFEETAIFTVSGSFGDADLVIVNGTNNHDVMRVNSPNRQVSVANAVGTLFEIVNLDDDVEHVLASAGLGNDTILVVPAPATQLGPGGAGGGVLVPINLLISIDGGPPTASDALVIAGDVFGGNLPATDFVVVYKSRTPDSGNIRVFRSAVAMPDIAYSNVEIVSPLVFPVDPDTGDPNLLILGPDLFEENEFRTTAAFLGTGATINVHNLAIFPNATEHRFVPADVDYFRVVAEMTGTLDFTIFFRMFDPDLFPAGGNLNIRVLDSDGTVIGGTGTFGIQDATPNARVRIPAVAGQTYYLHVAGVNSDVVNGYDLTVVNEPPPVPYDLELADIVGVSTVAPGATTTMVVGNPNPSLSAVDDFYNGKFIYFTSGTQAGRRADILDYVGATRTFTLEAGDLLTAPGTGDSFVVETHDTGRSQLDNITRDDTPVIRFRLDDAIYLHDLPGNPVNDLPADSLPPDTIKVIPFNPAQTAATNMAGYRVAIFIEGPPQHGGGQLPQDPVGYARMLFEGVYEFDFGRDAIPGNNAFPLTPNDGSYFVSAKVQIIDPATPTQTGFGARSKSLEFVVDTQTPPVYFGDAIVANDGLHPTSDTGVPAMPDTFTDRITSDTTPTFWGLAEADAIVRLYVDTNNSGALDAGDIQIAEVVAVPLDGTNQFPSGEWIATTNVDMNDPRLGLGVDGVRTILVTAEDVSGNVNPSPVQTIQSLTIFIDTRGPQVTNVFVTSDPGYDLFDPKPSTDGPTPLVFQLSVDVQDFPARALNFLYAAIKTNPEATDLATGMVINASVLLPPGYVIVKGDANGVIAIESVRFESDQVFPGSIATGTIIISFFEPLPDDRFTLTVTDDIRDRAGNQLDGESHAIEPQETPIFPSGDLIPGGDFVARFTVDSRPEIGTWAGVSVYVDTNGNFYFDPENPDDTNEDIVYTFGFTSDDIFAGNFSFGEDEGEDDGNADGFDKLAAYGDVGQPSTSTDFRWLIDVNNDGVPDLDIPDPANINGLPVAGRFDNNDGNGDEVGLFTGRTWYFDTNHDFNVDFVLDSDLRGYPMVGDFDGDGFDDLGTYNEQENRFEFDFADGARRGWDGNVDQVIYFGFPGIRERPVAADMDQDGFDDFGLWVPDRAGVAPAESGEFFILVSDGDSLFERTVNTYLGELPTIDFTPVPFGSDLFAQFGDEFALPVVGNFDPPVRSPSSGGSGAMTNLDNPYDVNADGLVSALDALMVINVLGDGNGYDPTKTTMYPDTNADGEIGPLDALLVINNLPTSSNAPQAPLGGGATSGGSTYGGANQRSAVRDDSAAGTDSGPAAVAADAVFSRPLVSLLPIDSRQQDDESTAPDDWDDLLSDVAQEVAAEWGA
jgi:hypothetical protein